LFLTGISGYGTAPGRRLYGRRRCGLALGVVMALAWVALLGCRPEAASIECRATNAGVILDAEAG
jgi:hypothetical protein